MKITTLNRFILLGVMVWGMIFLGLNDLFAASAVLTWDPPVTNEDGTYLNDLAGYKVYYGTGSGDYTESVDAGNTVVYEVGNLAEGGTYYFAATAYDSAGNESRYSEEISKTFTGDDPVNYYCDSDNDGYTGISIDGSCTGAGCEPDGCRTMPGTDCNNNDPGIFPDAADDTCNGIDENCDGVPDNNYVTSVVSCGTGVCSAVGQVECVEGSEVNSCIPGIPAEAPETTCGDGLDNDCDGEVDEECAPDIEVGSVLLSEDFSAGIPADWYGVGVWNTDNECGRTIGDPFEGQYAIVDSFCDVTSRDELVTGVFDASSCGTVSLEFNSQYRWHSGNAEVNVSSDKGAAWENIVSIAADDGYPVPGWKEIDISSLAGLSEAQIMFSYTNDTADGFWAIDNILVACRSDQVSFSAPVQETAVKRIIVSNRGDGDLVIDTIGVEGADASEFRVGEGDRCTGQALLPGASCTVDIVFVPLTKGDKSAELIVFSNDRVTPALSVLLAGSVEDVILPVPVIKVNGATGVVDIKRGEDIKVGIELDPGSLNGKDADWWLLMNYRDRWYSYDESSVRWSKGDTVYRQGQLTEIAETEVFHSSKSLQDSYTIYFGVDTTMNGILDMGEFYYDSIVVKIN